MTSILLMVLSFAIGVYAIQYLRGYDVHEREPFFKMLIVTIWGGAWSIGIAFALYKQLKIFGVDVIPDMFSAIFYIGPIEEISKLAGLLMSYLFIKNDINEPIDGVIYMSCVALGFSVVENYFYVINSDNYASTMSARLMVATPMHICISVFMGLAVYILISRKSGWILLAISYAYASVSHGVYDAAVFSKYGYPVALLIILVTRLWMLKLLEFTNAVSPFGTTLKEFVRDNRCFDDKTGVECLSCASQAPKEKYKQGIISIYKCLNCGKYLTSRENIFHIFHRFGSVYSGLTSAYISKYDNKSEYSTLIEGNYISDEKKLAFFDLNEFDAVLEKRKKRVINSMYGFVKKLFVS